MSLPRPGPGASVRVHLALIFTWPILPRATRIELCVCGLPELVQVHELDIRHQRAQLSQGQGGGRGGVGGSHIRKNPNNERTRRLYPPISNLTHLFDNMLYMGIEVIQHIITTNSI